MSSPARRSAEDRREFRTALKHVIFRSWLEGFPPGKENEKTQPGHLEKNQNQWEKNIFSRSDWSTVWNTSERSSTGTCPKKPSDSGLYMTLVNPLW